MRIGRGQFSIFFAAALSLISLATSINVFAHDDCGRDEFTQDLNFRTLACTRASSKQLAEVVLGNSKVDKFLDYCGQTTQGSAWCNQLVRPNPSSINTFRCTYGESVPHRLIHPDESTWKNAAQAVRLVERLEDNGIKVCEIYNWWRPEPYNKNVGGAATRHPKGTSVDVRFCSMNDMERAHRILCSWRKQGSLRALGYYGSTGLHFGVGDSIANTWGKDCT